MNYKIHKISFKQWSYFSDYWVTNKQLIDSSSILWQLNRVFKGIARNFLLESEQLEALQYVDLDFRYLDDNEIVV